MKRWLFITALPLAVAAGLALSVAVAGSPFASDDPSSEGLVREGDQGSAMPVPSDDGTPPVTDTVVEDDAGDTAPGPDDPAVSPVTSIDDIPEDECNLVHNIDACERIAIDAAKADLTARIGVPAQDIEVSVIEATYWDGCLGIETPGMACIQIAVPGYRIVLTAEGVTYEYHADTTGKVALVP